MNLLDISSQLQDLEAKEDLLSWKIDTWCAWPILRFSLSAIAGNLAVDAKPIHLQVPEYLAYSIPDFLWFYRKTKTDILIHTPSSNRVEMEGEKFKDIIFDNLLSHFSMYFKIEEINNKFYLHNSKKALFPSQMTTSFIYLISGFLSKYIHLAQIDQLSNYFYSIIQNNQFSSKITKKRVSRILSSFYWRKRIFHRLLTNLNPKILLLQTGYVNHPIIAAAKELKIKVIEFQHGVIDEYHPGYSWASPSLKYKKYMPIPDSIFVYGDYWREELIKNGFWGDDIKSVGSLRIDEYRSHGAFIRTISNKKEKIKNIVLTTQYIDTEKIIIFLIDFLKICSLGVELFIKLHPREPSSKNYLSAFGNNSNVHIIAGHELPSTFHLLSNADYHVSIHSTCHYEALGLGVPTIILPFTNYERMLPLSNRFPDYANIVKNPREMCQIIEQDRIIPTEVSSFYFRHDAKQNMINLIEHDLL